MDYSKVISFSELVKAANECAKGVRWKNSVSKWIFNIHKNVSDLRSKLLEGSYHLQPYVKFEVYEPKHRTICSTKFVDRVLQRSLCNNGLYDAFTKPLIYDNGACQVGKGTTFTLNRLISHLQHYFRHNSTNYGYYMLIDIKNYFGSTPHQLLKECVAKYVSEVHFRDHVFEIIDSFKDNRPLTEINKDPFGQRGVGLGSQVSQLLQLLYLNDIDHYAKEVLKIKHYIRYMDDILIFDRDKENVIRWFHNISNLINQKGLTVNPKSRIGRLQDGIIYLKVNFKLTNTGKVTKRLVRSSINRELRRITKLISLLKQSKLSYKELLNHFNSWTGHSLPRMSRNQFRIINKHLMKEINKP